MLERLKALFDENIQVIQPNQNDIQLAAATLMFEMVRSDGHIDDAEIEQMRAILGEHFSLNQQDVEALLAEAQNSAEEATSLQGFTRKVCEHWNNEQRVQLIEYLWILALADQRIDAHERHFVRKIAGLLYMTDRQINVAREAAKSKLDLNIK